MLQKFLKKQSRANRVRAKITGTSTKPRLSVFRSNSHISVQAIDDVNSVTLASAIDMKISGTKTEKAQQVGNEIAEILLKMGVNTCIFDRGGCLYHGRVKALAESARLAGLKF